MLAINELSFSGIVSDKSVNEKGTYFTLSQRVYGKIDTALEVFAPLIAFPEGLPIENGDTVYISSALLYQNGNGYLARIAHKEQLQIVEKNFDLGEISADKEFKL